MRKIVAVITMILTTVMVGILLINGKKENTDVTKVRTKVGVLLIGACDDGSYSQAHYEGLEKVSKKLNLDVTYIEQAPADEGCAEQIEELVQDGCRMIICNSYDFGKEVLRAAEKYPEVCFFHTAGTEQRKNLTTFFGRIYQIRYLCGIVAGLQTQTNEIGYVASFPIAEVNRGINAFTLGVRSVNPNASVHVAWVGSWTADKETKAAAETLLDSYEIDVLAMHTDSLSALEAAKERGIWSIGCNIDNSERYPDTFLTAPVWQWENYYEPYILKCLQGKFKGENYWEGASTGVVGLAPLTVHVKPGIAKTVDEVMKKLKEGSFDVFYGPITDNQGILRVGEGESMPDEVILKHFDWYVEGVELNE